MAAGEDNYSIKLHNSGSPKLTQIGDWMIKDTLGSGSFSKVKRAEHIASGQQVSGNAFTDVVLVTARHRWQSRYWTWRQWLWDALVTVWRNEKIELCEK